MRKKQITVAVILTSVLVLCSGCNSKKDSEEAIYYSAQSTKDVSQSAVEDFDENEDDKENDRQENLAEGTPLEDFSYGYDGDLQGVKITGYHGTSMKVVIPEEIEGEPVVKISGAFLNAEIMSVELPDSIRSISDQSFENCDGLTQIDLPTNLEEIGWEAFMGCSNLEEIIIPDNVTVIESEAFLACRKLKKVVLPLNIERIEDHAFSGCSDLEQVIFQDPQQSVEIGDSFANALKLDSSSKEAILKRNPELVWNEEYGIVPQDSVPGAAAEE